LAPISRRARRASRHVTPVCVCVGRRARSQHNTTAQHLNAVIGTIGSIVLENAIGSEELGLGVVVVEDLGLGLKSPPAWCSGTACEGWMRRVGWVGWMRWVDGWVKKAGPWGRGHGAGGLDVRSGEYQANTRAPSLKYRGREFW
jgi:hypothetical protein